MAHEQQLTFTKRENEIEAIKFLEIFSKLYPTIDKNYQIFWRNVQEECQKENVYPEATVADIYTTIWPNFLAKAHENSHNNGLTKVDQMVMDISKTRNPHWWGNAAGKEARGRAIRGYCPPKISIIEPLRVSNERKKKKDIAGPSMASITKPPRPKKPLKAIIPKTVDIDYSTPLTSRPHLSLRHRQPSPILELHESNACRPSSSPAIPKPPCPTPSIPSLLTSRIPPIFNFDFVLPLPPTPPDLTMEEASSSLFDSFLSTSTTPSTAPKENFMIPRSFGSFQLQPFSEDESGIDNKL